MIAHAPETPLQPAEPSIGLLTMSFRGDLELCRLLCETVDAWVPPSFAHILAVPRSDLKLFSPLANARRELVAQEEFLPGWLHKLPLPSPEWRRRLRLPRRNLYVTSRGRPVRGWIAQQFMKLEAAARAGRDIILHVDSDVAFVRPLAREHLVRDGKVRLLRVEGHGDTAMHQPWHRAAAAMLGLPPTGYHGADFIGNLTVWRRSVVAMLLTRIADVSKMEAFEALARTPDWSEYILYGVFCDRVLGLDGSGHWPTDRLLCATVWPSSDADGVTSQLDRLRVDVDQVAVGIQSTVPMTIAQRRQIANGLMPTQAQTLAG